MRRPPLRFPVPVTVRRSLERRMTEAFARLPRRLQYEAKRLLPKPYKALIQLLLHCDAGRPIVRDVAGFADLFGVRRGEFRAIISALTRHGFITYTPGKGQGPGLGTGPGTILVHDRCSCDSSTPNAHPAHVQRTPSTRATRTKGAPSAGDLVIREKEKKRKETPPAASSRSRAADAAADEAKAQALADTLARESAWVADVRRFLTVLDGDAELLALVTAGAAAALDRLRRQTAKGRKPLTGPTDLAAVLAALPAERRAGFAIAGAA